MLSVGNQLGNITSYEGGVRVLGPAAEPGACFNHYMCETFTGQKQADFNLATDFPDLRKNPDPAQDSSLDEFLRLVFACF